MDYAIISRYIDHLINESTPEKPLWNIERVRHGNPPHWNYIDGCMLLSLWQMYLQTSEERYAKFADSFMDYYINDDGTPLGYKRETYNLDNICPGRVLFDLYNYSGKEKYLKAIDILVKQLENQPRTHEGNFWHKAIYPNQVWLDGLFMAQVFHTRYALANDRDDILNDMLRQFKTVREKMFVDETKLYCHGYDASKSVFWADKETGRSLGFWLRAMGWYAVALSDIIEYLPPGEHKRHLSLLLKEMIENVVCYVDKESGLFWQVVDKGGVEGNYLETSGTSMLSYAILKGTRIGVLNHEMRSLGLRAFDGICNKYLKETENGLNLGGICLVAGLGPENDKRRNGTFDYYISEPVVENDAKGVAPFLMAYTEFLRRT